MTVFLPNEDWRQDSYFDTKGTILPTDRRR
jgi:hypothetical protein